MFIAAMSTIAKLWKEPRCPSTGEWIKKIWFIYTMEYYSAIRKDEYPPFVTTWMDLEDIMLSEMSDGERQILYDFTHMWNLRNKANKQRKKRERQTKKQIHNYGEQIDGNQEGRWRGVK